MTLEPTPDPCQRQSEEMLNSHPGVDSDSGSSLRFIKWRSIVRWGVTILNVLAAAAAVFGVAVYVSESPHRARSSLVEEAELRANVFAKIEELRKSSEMAEVTNLDAIHHNPDCKTAKDQRNPSLPFWACPRAYKARPEIPSYALSALGLVPESLTNENLDDLSIQRANWPSERFHSTSLRFSSIVDSNLDNAELTHVDAAFSSLSRVSLKSSCVVQLQSQSTEFDAVDLSGARINGWDANGGAFNQVSLAGTKIFQGEFIGAVFVLTDFRNSTINYKNETYPCGRADHLSFNIPTYRLNNLFVTSGTLDDPYWYSSATNTGAGSYRPRILVAFSDLRSARISFDMFGQNDASDVIYMNVCTNDATHVSPSPPSAAIDCSWVGKSILTQVEPRYDRRFQHLIRFNKELGVVRVDMGVTMGFHRMASFNTILVDDPF